MRKTEAQLCCNYCHLSSSTAQNSSTIPPFRNILKVNQKMENTVTTILSNAGQLMAEEFLLLHAVGDEVNELRDELATMNAVLRMHSETEDGAVDHFVREWMKQVRELSCDAEDCVDLYLFRIKCRPSDGFLVRSNRLLATFFPRRRLAGGIKALRARAVAISERHARYGMSRDALRPSPSSAPVMAVAPSVQPLRHANDRNQFVGMQEQAKELADKVKAMNVEEGGRNVLSIVGFGGLGKTTLAMEVCRQVEAEFDRRAQVSVSQAFDGRRDMPELLKRVLRQIAKPKARNEEGIKEEDPIGDIDKLNEHELARKLEDLLNNKRYIIVIDDVWTTTAWNAIQTKLPNQRCGSRVLVLVTTRIEKVAKECSASEDYIYKIKPLNSKYSEELFLSRAFGSTCASCPKKLRCTMGKILKKCAGLPLAIVSIASLLASYQNAESIHMWERIYRSIGSQMESNPTLEGMRQIIALSYNHLTHDLKRCMMYISIFPEDYLIRKNRLLNRWIAEGLIPEKRGLTLMETAEAYFNELVNRSMIDQAACVVSYYDRVDMCRVHDMMLEVMVSKSLEANFVSLVGIQYEGMSYNMIRRLSIHGGQQGAKDSTSNQRATGHGRVNAIEGINVQHVRSLTTFQSEGNKLLLDQLQKFKLLRVLDLEDCKDLKNKHLRYVCQMYLLRFLSLRGTDVSVMPPEVGDLEYLQTLDVDKTLLKKLPNTVIKLSKLERLMFSHKEKWDIFWMLPKGVYKMKALREVSRVTIKDVEGANEIGDLQQLERIHIYLDKKSKQIGEIRRHLGLSLCKTSSLRWLDVGDFDCVSNEMDYLISLDTPPQLLYYLRFSSMISRIPDWVGSLTYLAEFTISSTSLVGGQPFDVLCKAPNLTSILFQKRFYAGKELVASSAQVFPMLKNMRVTSAVETPEEFHFEEESMRKLEFLEVDFGVWGKSIFGMEHLTNLKEVRLTGARDNSSLINAVNELKAESDRRRESNQFPFTVGVRYD